MSTSIQLEAQAFCDYNEEVTTKGHNLKSKGRLSKQERKQVKSYKQRRRSKHYMVE